MKRLFDIIFAAIGLLLLSPLLVIVAILVKLTSKGPVLFCQKRVGRYGKEFFLYKFRSMTVLAEAMNGSFDAGNASRVTTLGRILRKTKIDELPQLWNVFVGDMSFVGPRPEVRKWVEAYPERWKVVHMIRPGITDPASIAFRNEEELLAASPNPEQAYRSTILPRKLDLCEEYLRNRSFLGDCFIIAQTLGVVLCKTKATSSDNRLS